MSTVNDKLHPVADSSGRPIPGLYKSESTGAIVTEKNSEYQKYLRERENLKKVNNLSNQVEELKSEMSEIKNLLRQSLSNNGKNE